MFSESYETKANQQATTTNNFNYTSNPTMLQSVGIAVDEGYLREMTTDNNPEKEIGLSISPFVIANGTNVSESTSANEALNHHWSFYIEVRYILRVNLIN